ncbi:hypothetical protein ACFSR7_30145 [Cohnella sp. GCM10020058]|uniref:hypothetical protein n=1 Tax=Cohnella sp. GCM10020058 TaxID=3317330 RepID=UPI00362B96B5
MTAVLKDTDQLDDLKAFLIDWYGKYDRANGVPAEEVPADLPKALRELYAFAGRWKDGSDRHLERSPEIFQQQDCLCAAEMLRREGDRITFLEENQANWTCQVEAGNDESPVYCDEGSLWDDDAKGHIVVQRSLYHFLKTFCLQEIVFGCKYLYVAEGEIELNRVGLERPVEAVWFNGHYTGLDTEGPTHAFYRTGTILMMERYGDLWLGSNSESIVDWLARLTTSIRWRQIKPD